MLDKEIVLPIVPFFGVVSSLLNGAAVNNIRCGAGWAFWVVTTTGDIYPCPVMRNYKKYLIGNIANISPLDIHPKFSIKEPCTSCNIFNICGGRCLCANLQNEWDKEGFKLVCGSVRNLIDGLVESLPTIKGLVERGKIQMSEFETFHDYEVIP